MKKIILLNFLLIILLLPDRAFAFEWAGPDAWFRIDIAIDKNTLPEGVRLVRNSDPRVEYGLENIGDSPLYLIQKASPETIPGPPISQGFIPLFKLVSGNAYIPASAYDRDKADAEGYVLNMGGLDVFSHQAILYEDFFKEYGIDIKNKYADNRPADAKLPSPHSFELLAHYEGNIIKIKGTISYKLKEDYNPRQEAESLEAAKKFEESYGRKEGFSGLGWLYLVLLSIFIGYLFYRLIYKKRTI